MKSSCSLLLALLLAPLAVSAQTPAPLKLEKTISLKPVSSKFDHLAFDAAANRLFITATSNHSVEVIDLKTDSISQSITGLGKPHGLAWVASTGSLYVSDGSLAELRVYKGSPLALAGSIKLSEDADDMVYDEANHLLFVGHGTGEAASPARVSVVDTAHFTLVANLAVATHPEALDIDPAGHRVFVNIADSNEIVVIDTATRAITAHWKLTKAAGNVPLAFDADHNLLFVGCRKPGAVIVLDASTGKELSSLPGAAGADDLFYDPALRSIYLIAGSGEVDAYQVDASKAIHSLGVLPTASGAKTALWVPAQNLLYVGVPGPSGQPSEIRAFAPAAGAGK